MKILLSFLFTPKLLAIALNDIPNRSNSPTFLD
jgi:hypothetical protein